MALDIRQPRGGKNQHGRLSTCNEYLPGDAAWEEDLEVSRAGEPETPGAGACLPASQSGKLAIAYNTVLETLQHLVSKMRPWLGPPSTQSSSCFVLGMTSCCCQFGPSCLAQNVYPLRISFSTACLQETIAFGSIISTGSHGSITLKWPQAVLSQLNSSSNSKAQVCCAVNQMTSKDRAAAYFAALPGSIDACCQVEVSKASRLMQRLSGRHAVYNRLHRIRNRTLPPKTKHASNTATTIPSLWTATSRLTCNPLFPG